MEQRRRITKDLRFKDEGAECVQELADALVKIEGTSSEIEISEIAAAALERFRYKRHRVRFTKTENAILIEKAKTSGCTVSDYIRKSALHRVGRAPSPRVAVLALVDVLAALRKRHPLDHETAALVISAIYESGGVINDL